MSEETMQCSSCRTAIPGDSDFCPLCGTLAQTEGVVCVTHQDHEALGVCVICSEPYCSDCLMKIKGQYLCARHSMVEVIREWARAYETTDTTDAQMIQGALEQNGFRVVTQNTSSVAYVGAQLGETGFQRSVSKRPVKIFVPADRFDEAVAFLTEWQKGTPVDDGV